MYALYNITAYAMKAVDPSIQIGGPAFSYASVSDAINFVKSAGPCIFLIVLFSIIFHLIF